MRSFLIPIVLVLAACQGAPPQQPGNEAGATAGDMQNRLAALSEAERNGVFIRAIRDANQDCQYVESSAPAGTYRGAPLWSARCQGGGTYTIAIGNGGEAQVIDDAVARLPGNEAAPAAPANSQ